MTEGARNIIHLGVHRRRAAAGDVRPLSVALTRLG